MLSNTAAVPLTKKTLNTDLRAIQDKAACEGDVATLVGSVEGTIRQIARQFGRGLSKTDLEDLHAAGKIGAVVAANRYAADDVRGASFNTYAFYWIRYHVVNEVFFFWGKGRCKITRATAKVFYRYGRAKRELDASGVEVTPEALAEALDVPVAVLESVTGSVAAAHGILTDLPDESSSVLATLCSHADVDEVRIALEKLDRRSRYVVEQNFFQGRTHEEIGTALRLTKQRVQQIERGALAKLRQLLS